MCHRKLRGGGSRKSSYRSPSLQLVPRVWLVKRQPRLTSLWSPVPSLTWHAQFALCPLPSQRLRLDPLLQQADLARWASRRLREYHVTMALPRVFASPKWTRAAEIFDLPCCDAVTDLPSAELASLEQRLSRLGAALSQRHAQTVCAENRRRRDRQAEQGCAAAYRFLREETLDTLVPGTEAGGTGTVLAAETNKWAALWAPCSRADQDVEAMAEYFHAAGPVASP
jgi:hypothetical protein